MTKENARLIIRQLYLEIEWIQIQITVAPFGGAWDGEKETPAMEETIAYLERKYDLAKENLWDNWDPENDRD